MHGVSKGRRFWVFYDEDYKQKSLRVIDDCIDRTIKLKDIFEVDIVNEVFNDAPYRRVYLYFKTDWHTEKDPDGKSFLTDLRCVELIFDNTPDEDIDEYDDWEDFLNQFRELVE